MAVMKLDRVSWLKGFVGLLLIGVTIGASAQRGVPRARVIQPGDQWEYKVTLKRTLSDLQDTQTGSLMIKILPQIVKSPKGVYCLQEQNTLTIQGLAGSSKEVSIELVSQAPDGSKRRHGEIRGGKTVWVNNAKGFVVVDPGIYRIGAAGNSGKFSYSDKTTGLDIVKIVGYEKVTTGKGVIPAYKMSMVNSRGDITQKGAIYLSPEWGAIKYILDGSDKLGANSYRFNAILKSAKLAQSKTPLKKFGKKKVYKRRYFRSKRRR